MPRNSNIFLIGFMGCGKSSLGKKIANKLNYNFIDIDQEIEKELNLSINEIFSVYGEDFFRLKESEYLKRLSLVNGNVLATGGGMPCYNDNMDVMNSLGLTIYLQRPAKELFHRLKNAKQKRPLISNKSDSELLTFIEDSLVVRELDYKKASLILPREMQVVSRIIQLLEYHQPPRKD